MYVYESIDSDAPLYSIDLQCAAIEILPKTESSTGTTFEIAVDRGKKIYAFRTKGNLITSNITLPEIY